MENTERPVPGLKERLEWKIEKIINAILEKDPKDITYNEYRILDRRLEQINYEEYRKKHSMDYMKTLSSLMDSCASPIPPKELPDSNE